MAMTARLWTLNGLATELGRDRRAIGKALAGVPPDGKSGRADAWLMRRAVAAIYAAAAEPTLDDERARLARAQAEKVEMQNAVMRGELLPRADVDAAVVEDYSRVRARLLAIPSKVAHALIGITEPRQADATVRAAVYEALTELAEGPAVERAAEGTLQR